MEQVGAGPALLAEVVGPVLHQPGVGLVETLLAVAAGPGVVESQDDVVDGLAPAGPGGEGGPEHLHEDDIIEAFFFIKGEGVLTIGDQEFPIKSNVGAWAPPGVPHKIVNTGKENLTFVWIFCPPKSDQL